MLYAMASADNTKVAELLEQLRAEMKKLAMGGVTENELAEAKTYLTGSFALRFNSSSGIANVLLEIQRLELPPSEERANLINSVSGGDVARLADLLIKPDNLTVVAVGNPEGLSASRRLTVQP